MKTLCCHLSEKRNNLGISLLDLFRNKEAERKMNLFSHLITCDFFLPYWVCPENRTLLSSKKLFVFRPVFSFERGLLYDS
jgi:hypothetical protein